MPCLEFTRFVPGLCYGGIVVEMVIVFVYLDIPDLIYSDVNANVYFCSV